MVGIENDWQDGLVYKCVKDVVLHNSGKRYSFVLGKTYHVTKMKLFDGGGVYTYLINRPEKDLIIAPLFLDSFFSKIEEKN